jgi:uridine phosphorylase
MSTNDPRASEAPKTSEGRLYHIDVGPGELAPYILMCVDQVRAKRVADLFDEVTVERSCREILTCTGSYQGIPISVIGTGIGPDNTEIIFVEAVQLFPETRPTMIRVGSSGGLQAKVAIGDLVISTGAVRLENTSTGFVDPGYPAVAHHEVILALIAAADQVGAPYHVGLTASASGLFGAQEVCRGPTRPGPGRAPAAGVLECPQHGDGGQRPLHPRQPGWRADRGGLQHLFQPSPG